jgi:hypothetical protein
VREASFVGEASFISRAAVNPSLVAADKTSRFVRRGKQMERFALSARDRLDAHDSVLASHKKKGRRSAPKREAFRLLAIAAVVVVGVGR